MNKITAAFQHGKAFIPFLTGGDPDIETTEKLIRAMAEAGADIIEIGVPFSDPIAEGTVIQEASQRALQGGVTVDQLFDMVSRLRRDIQIPFLFMGYANSVYGYGAEKYMERCREAGVDGVIVGSAIVKLIAEHGRDSVPVVYDYVKRMKDAIRDC